MSSTCLQGGSPGACGGRAPRACGRMHRMHSSAADLRCGRIRRRQLACPDVAVLGAGNFMGFPRAPPEYNEKQCLLRASKGDRRGPVGDVRLARAAECIECIAAADCRSDTPLAARRIGSEPLVRWGFALGYRFVYRGANLALSSRPSPAQPAPNVHFWLRPVPGPVPVAVL